MGKTVPEVLSNARGRRSRAVLKTEDTVFPSTDRLRLVNNILVFFFNLTKFFPKKTRMIYGCNYGKIFPKLNSF